MVVRVTDVKPLMTVAAYTCEQCGYELYQSVRASRPICSLLCILTRYRACVNDTAGEQIFLAVAAVPGANVRLVSVSRLHDQAVARRTRRSAI